MRAAHARQEAPRAPSTLVRMRLGRRTRAGSCSAEAARLLLLWRPRRLRRLCRLADGDALLLELLVLRARLVEDGALRREADVVHVDIAIYRIVRADVGTDVREVERQRHARGDAAGVKGASTGNGVERAIASPWKAREEAIIGGIVERDPIEDVAMRPPIGAKVAVPITRDRRPPILRLLLRQ